MNPSGLTTSQKIAQLRAAAFKLIRKFGYDLRSEGNAPLILAEYLSKSKDEYTSEYGLAIYRALENLMRYADTFQHELELLLAQLPEIPCADPATLSSQIPPNQCVSPSSKTASSKEFGSFENHKPTNDGRNVMVVEDNVMNRTLIERILRTEGYSVTTAQSGEEALTLAEKAVFQLVLMDISLPGMDGFETTLRLRDDIRYESVPIVALSAYSKTEILNAAVEVGMIGFIPKPVDRKKLLRAVQKLLSSAT